MKLLSPSSIRRLTACQICRGEVVARKEGSTQSEKRQYPTQRYPEQVKCFEMFWTFKGHVSTDIHPTGEPHYSERKVYHRDIFWTRPQNFFPFLLLDWVKNYSKGLRNAHISSGSGRLQGEGQLLQLLWLALTDAKPRQQRGCGTTKKPHRD